MKVVHNLFLLNSVADLEKLAGRGDFPLGHSLLCDVGHPLQASLSITLLLLCVTLTNEKSVNRHDTPNRVGRGVGCDPC